MKPTHSPVTHTTMDPGHSEVDIGHPCGSGHIPGYPTRSLGHLPRSTCNGSRSSWNGHMSSRSGSGHSTVSPGYPEVEAGHSTVTLRSHHSGPPSSHRKLSHLPIDPTEIPTQLPACLQTPLLCPLCPQAVLGAGEPLNCDAWRDLLAACLHSDKGPHMKHWVPLEVSLQHLALELG